MNILLTGASGFVGKATLAQLQRLPGTHIRLALRQPLADFAREHQHMISGIDANTHWTSALQGIDTVVHLAARVHVMRDTATDPLAAFRAVNVDGTLALARQAVELGVRRFVYVSSVKVLGESNAPNSAFTEDSPSDARDPYGISKLEAENGLKSLAEQTGLDMVILRPPLVYGPGVGANFQALMRAVQRGIPLPLGSIHNQRSLVSVHNLASAICLCTHHAKAINQTFLISDQRDLSTPELVRGIAKAMGRPARLLPVPPTLLNVLGKLTGRSAAVQRLCGDLRVDSKKISQLLGWQPVLTVQEALDAAASTGAQS